MLRPFINLLRYTAKKDKLLLAYIQTLTGKAPRNLSVYFLALRHSSLTKEKAESVTHSNERLEFLGDAILGAIVAEYLFKKYPFKDEGFLTEIRSRIVNGETLGRLAKKIGLGTFIEYNSRSRGLASRSSMHGDAMEAFIGAIYLDRGYDFCRKFVLTRLIDTHYDIDLVVNTDINYKSQLIVLAQTMNKKVHFEIFEKTENKGYSEFTAYAKVDGVQVSTGKGSSKKRAEQDAARRGLEALQNATNTKKEPQFDLPKNKKSKETENSVATKPQTEILQNETLEAENAQSEVVEVNQEFDIAQEEEIAEVVESTQIVIPKNKRKVEEIAAEQQENVVFSEFLPVNEEQNQEAEDSE